MMAPARYIILACILVMQFMGTNRASYVRAQESHALSFSDDDMAEDLAEAGTFQKYPTYTQYLQLMQGFAMDYPSLCRLDTFGTSVGGRLLLALEISDNAGIREPEPGFLYTSTMHGDEIAGMVLMLRLADTLLSGYEQDAEIKRLVDELSIRINPLANPDGCYAADNDLSMLNSGRENLNEVDLNRDFPDPAEAENDDTTGREAETRHMMNFLQEHRFTMAANIHGGEEVVNYPWDYTYDLHADDEWYRLVSHEYADEAMSVDPEYMFGWPDGGITNGAAWYPTHGNRQDYVNYYLGGREVTLELHKIKLLPSSELEHLWNINYRSLLNYMAQSNYGFHGKVSDQDDGKSLDASIEILHHDNAYSKVRTALPHGDFHRPVKAGSYDLVASASGYLDDTIFGAVSMDYTLTRADFQLEKDPETGMSGETAGAQLQILPNPANSILQIIIGDISRSRIQLRIFDVDGRMQYATELRPGKQSHRVRVDSWKPGLYLVQCATGKKIITRHLLVLKR